MHVSGGQHAVHALDSSHEWTAPYSSWIQTSESCLTLHKIKLQKNDIEKNDISEIL